MNKGRCATLLASVEFTPFYVGVNIRDCIKVSVFFYLLICLSGLDLPRVKRVASPTWQTLQERDTLHRTDANGKTLKTESWLIQVCVEAIQRLFAQGGAQVFCRT